MRKVIVVIIFIVVSGPAFLAETGAHVGRVFAVHPHHIEITGDNIQKLRKGARLAVLAQKGEVLVIVTETFHTKLNCRVVGKKHNWIKPGDEVRIPLPKKPEIKPPAKKPDPVPAKKTSGSLTDNKDGTIFDSKTNLTWKKCSEGQNNDATCSGVAQGFAFCPTADNNCNGNISGAKLGNGPLYEACDRLNRESFAGQKTWRVPSGDELKSLVVCNDGKPVPNAAQYCEGNRTGPVIDTKFFPATQAGHYWTSNSSGEDPKNAWVVYFYNGLHDHFQKTNRFDVRCVSGP